MKQYDLKKERMEGNGYTRGYDDAVSVCFQVTKEGMRYNLCNLLTNTISLQHLSQLRGQSY